MQDKNPIAVKLAAHKDLPVFLKDSAVELTETLDLCWTAARAVFDESATPDHAIALLPIFMARSDAKRQQVIDELLGGRVGTTARF